MRALFRLAAVVAGVASTACGTAVFHHRIEVTVSDPAGRLGPPPHQVSVFDRQNDYSQAFSNRFLGPTTPNAPYVHEMSDTATKMLWDSTPPDELVASVAVPAYSADGFFLVIMRPRSGETRSVDAPFVAFDSYFPAQGAETLSVTYLAAAEADGWRIRVTLEIPPP